MVKVKVCGITRVDDLQAAIDAGADSLGFIVDVPSSPRNLPYSKAKSLISQAQKSVTTVAVTMFTDMEKLKQISTETNADYLQLHGLHYVHKSTLDSSLRRRIIAAVDARAEDALELAVAYSDVFTSILIDTARDDGVGGTGIIHNWALSRRIRDAIYPASSILAGGLTPENVSEAIRVVKSYGVDVSTGVERQPGIKDHQKMREFIARAKEEKL